jgi:hypothetical protein
LDAPSSAGSATITPTFQDMAYDSEFDFQCQPPVSEDSPSLSPLPAVANSDGFGAVAAGTGSIAKTSEKKKVTRKLSEFWSVETPEERVERTAREVELLRLDREDRMFAETRERLRRKDRQRAVDRERQRRHRDRSRERKIASGWVPRRKRVSEPVLNDAIHLHKIATEILSGI